jgi:hypothetical protein
MEIVSISKEPVILFFEVERKKKLLLHSLFSSFFFLPLLLTRLLREKSDYEKEIVNVKLSFETTTTIRPLTTGYKFHISHFISFFFIPLESLSLSHSLHRSLSLFLFCKQCSNDAFHSLNVLSSSHTGH